MSWVTIIWSMIASVSFTLATIYLLIWFRERRSWAYLCFFVLAVGVIGLATGEMGAMYAKSPTEYGTAVRWSHFAFGFVVLGSLGFVHFYFGTGKRWLLGAALGLRLLAVVANFTTGLNLHIRAIQSLLPANFLCEPVSMLGEWTPNPWVRLGQLAALAQFVYVVDATLRLWRTGARESRRRAVLVGGTLAFFILFASGQAGLVVAGVLRMPIIVSFPFLAVLLAMGYELSRDVLRAGQLSADLRESHQRLDLAAHSARLGLWTWDIAGDEIWATDNGRQLFGFGKLERINFARLISSLHPDDREPVNHAVAKSFNGNGDYESEHRVVVPGQPIRWIAARGSVEFNKAGKAVFMRGVSHDITERKRTEEALKESEARFRSVADTAPVLIWMAGTDKLCSFFNKSWLDFTGRALEQELGNGWAEGIHPDDQALCLKIYVEAFDARRPFTMEYRLRRHDGEYRWLSDHGVPRYDSGQNFLGYIGSCVDLTARKQAEAEALRQRAELAHVARVSTMGELAASVAHELNQPLGAILANAEAAELFLNQNPPALDELRDILTDIRKDDERASEVIRRMRALLRKHELDRQPLEINSVVEDVLQVISGDAALRKMAISADLAPGLPKILGDRVHLQQVLLNLLLNGMDAMAGEPRERRRLSLRTRLNPGGLVEIAVMDSGHGIPPEKLPSVFEPFYTTKPNGMGMGLSISRTIITAHHGKISVENNAAGGATFRVTLPVVKEG